MQIVIEIKNDAFERVKKLVDADYFDHNIEGYVMRCIANGTPLPKNHGDLIDRDWVKNTLDIYVLNQYHGQFIRRSDIDTIPTIIEGVKADDK